MDKCLSKTNVRGTVHGHRFLRKKRAAFYIGLRRHVLFRLAQFVSSKDSDVTTLCVGRLTQLQFLPSCHENNKTGRCTRTSFWTEIIIVDLCHSFCENYDCERKLM